MSDVNAVGQSAERHEASPRGSDGEHLATNVGVAVIMALAGLFIVVCGPTRP